MIDTIKKEERTEKRNFDGEEMIKNGIFLVRIVRDEPQRIRQLSK